MAVTADRSRAALADQLVSLLPALKRRFQATLAERLRDQLGAATAHQMEALHLLHHTLSQGQAGVTMNELARRQGCALSTASALTDRLLREGLVERTADPVDRRVVRVAPTQRGEALCAQFAEARRDLALEATRCLTVDEIATLIALLRKVANAPAPARVEAAADG